MRDRLEVLRTMTALRLCSVLLLGAPVPLHGQDLEAADVRVTLDSALRLAQTAAEAAFPDLSGYLLYSVSPRVLKGDPGGLHWQVQWQERAFPHRRRLGVRVYMTTGQVVAERLEDGQEPRPGQATPAP